MKRRTTAPGQLMGSSDDAIANSRMVVLFKRHPITDMVNKSRPVIGINRTQCDRLETFCRRCVGVQCVCTCPARKPLSLAVFAIPWSDVVAPYYNESSTRERSTFHLFRTQTVTSISGTFDQSFWDLSVRRSMRSSRAVWHAALAVAAIHERSRIHGETELASHFKRRYYEIALCQYNRSIQELTKVINRQHLSYAEKEAILVAIVLYSAISKIQGDDDTAHIHARTFVRLFCLWRFWDDANPLHLRGLTGPNILNALFHRFVGHHLVTRTPLPWAILDVPGLAIQPDSRLQGLDQPDIGAYYELYGILVSVLVRMRALYVNAEQPQRTKSRPGPRPDLLYSCRQAFKNWKATYSHLTAQFDRTKSFYLLCLQAQVIAIEIFLYTHPSDFGREWGKLAPLFSKGVDVSRELFALESDSVDRGEKDIDSPALSFNASACSVLYLICLNSRDRGITRQALALWKSWPRQEKIWTLEFDAQVLSEKLDVEDNGPLRYDCTILPAEGGECIPGGYVCENHRVTCREVHYRGNREGTLELKTAAEEQLQLPGRTIKLAW